MGAFTSYPHQENSNLDPEGQYIISLRKKLNLPEKIEAMFGLPSSFVSRKPSIEKSNWISNKRKDKTIQLDILKKHLYDTIKIKKVKN